MKKKIDKFEIGRYYKHHDAECIAVLCVTDTTQWGRCLIVECDRDSWGLLPINEKPTLPEDWEEITKEEWDARFEK